MLARHLLLCVALVGGMGAEAAHAQSAPARPDSVVGAPSGAALDALLERASRANRRVPDDLAAYAGRAESELSVLARRAEGTEAVAGIEQIASRVRWERTGTFEQRVIGHRMLSSGPQVAIISFFPTSYIIPTLYGNRLLLFFGAAPDDSTRRRRQARAAAARATRDSTRPRPPGVEASRIDSQLVAVHPLAESRDRYYTFTGGDTVVTLQPGSGRRVPIVRVRVTPRTGALGRALLFSGDIDLDASRDQLVALRGRFLVSRPPQRSLRQRVLSSAVDAIGYFEVVNSEVEGRWWVPTYQRFEGQIVSQLFSEGRFVIRVITRFADLVPTARAPLVAMGDSLAERAPVADTLQRKPFRLSFAPTDSLRAFGAWARPIGALSEGAHSDDFDDVAPNALRSTGAPLLTSQPERLTDILRLNRVEGAYVGAAGTLRLRDVAPGVVVRGVAGIAVAEGTLRGRFTVERRRNRWLTELRATRGLDITNKFRLPLDSGAVLAALLGEDPYDYVDRWGVTLGGGRVLDKFGSLVRVDVGRVHDREAVARFPAARVADGRTRPNRGIDAGQYWRTTGVLQWRPDINAEFLRPGVGALVQYEGGAGTLDYQRIEARALGRYNWNWLVWTSRVDVGALIADRPPPQQLFEIGRTQNLPGYGFKEFAGDRAAVARTLFLVPFHLWREPIHLGGPVRLPGLDPSFSIGLQAGWTEASSDAARAAIRRLGGTTDPVTGAFVPVSRPSDGWRASLDLRLRFFGGAVGLGMARPIDRSAPWRFVASVGQQL
ncbi:MAG: hypothetical protein MUF00_05605 [Gemmatimonadaceae bacterium]|jgi:hypothetical protein|nr:hypothetical protein [Gemmatimonadaceae bacterium]